MPTEVSRAVVLCRKKVDIFLALGNNVWEMANLPKLKVVNTLWDVPEETRDFEQGRGLPFCEQAMIIVEDQVIRSYDELLQLAAEECHRDKEFLKVMILPVIDGG